LDEWKASSQERIYLIINSF